MTILLFVGLIEYDYLLPGDCICNEGFTSDDCSIETRRPPTVYGVPGDGLCNTRTRPCQVTAVIGKDYLDSQNLTCKVTVYEVR